jgi:hypothetical protein
VLLAPAVPRWVPCAECGNRYDADVVGFCTRCGSTLRGKDPEVRVPVLAHDPRRRRVQMGGAILLFLGLAVAGVAVFFALLRGPDLSEMLVDVVGGSDVAGGHLNVHVVDAGQPVRNATIVIRDPGGVSLGLGATVENGWFNTTLARPAADLNITVGQAAFHRRAFVLSAQEQTVEVDVARDPLDQPGWSGLESFSGYGLYIAGGVLLTGLLAALAGAAALALRAQDFAVAGPVPLVLVTGFLLFFFGEVGLLLILGMEVLAMLMVASGRAAFRRRR